MIASFIYHVAGELYKDSVSNAVSESRAIQPGGLTGNSRGQAQRRPRIAVPQPFIQSRRDRMSSVVEPVVLPDLVNPGVAAVGDLGDQREVVAAGNLKPFEVE